MKKRFYVNNADPFMTYGYGALYPIEDREQKRRQVAFARDIGVANKIAAMLNREEKKKG